MTKRFYLLLFFLLMISSCSGSKGLRTIEGDPDVLYNQGLNYYNRRLYELALKKFEEVKSNYPDSPPYTTWAELKVADCHFHMGNYVEAIAAYEEFKKIHPAHEEIPYVQYQIGNAYFEQMLSIDRDQTATRKALSSFEYLVANLQPNLFTEKAKRKIEICRKHLAEHEFYVGNFYFKEGRYAAAARRFEALLSQFPNNPGEDRTLLMLAKSYMELGQTEKAKEVLTRLRENFPGSSYAKEAKTLLERGLHAKKLQPAQGRESSEEFSTEKLYLVRYEEEKKIPIAIDRKLGREVASVRREDSQERVSAETLRPSVVPERLEVEAEGRVTATGGFQPSGAEEHTKLKFSLEEEGRKELSAAVTPRKESLPTGEPRAFAGAALASRPRSEGKDQKIAPFESLEERAVEDGQPIEIISDRVEAHSKDNLIVFIGNVTARQRDVVIFADTIEAFILEDGKGIEKVVAGGNVRVKQGLRVANCEKAVFYNLEKKIVLTGDPKLWEGENMVTGQEIVFDIRENRVEVKGGTRGRGKATIRP